MPVTLRKPSEAGARGRAAEAKEKERDPLFRGGNSSDSDVEMDVAPKPKATSKGKGKAPVDSSAGETDDDRGEGSSRPSRQRRGSTTSNATSKSLALSESSIEEAERQRRGATSDNDMDEDQSGDEVDPEDDPDLVASIPVYIARSIPAGGSLQVFQYPNFRSGRPLPIPESAHERNIRETARWREGANWVEVDLPLDMRPQVYNDETGMELGQNLERENKAKKAKREDDDDAPRKLEKMRLQSNEVPHTTRYLVGVMRDGALHLTTLQHVLQLRPSLHHLDANDVAESDLRRRQREGEGGSGDEGRGPAPKARSISVSIKEDSNSKTGVKGGSAGGDKWEEQMLAQRKAEGEPWTNLKWVSEDSEHAKKAFNAQLFAGAKTQLACLAAPSDYLAKNLKSAAKP